MNLTAIACTVVLAFLCAATWCLCAAAKRGDRW